MRINQINLPGNFRPDTKKENLPKPKPKENKEDSEFMKLLKAK